MLCARLGTHHQHPIGPPVCTVGVALAVDNLRGHVLHRPAEGKGLLLMVNGLLTQAKVCGKEDKRTSSVLPRLPHGHLLHTQTPGLQASAHHSRDTQEAAEAQRGGQATCPGLHSGEVGFKPRPLQVRPGLFTTSECPVQPLGRRDPLALSPGPARALLPSPGT